MSVRLPMGQTPVWPALVPAAGWHSPPEQPAAGWTPKWPPFAGPNIARRRGWLQFSRYFGAVSPFALQEARTLFQSQVFAPTLREPKDEDLSVFLSISGLATCRASEVPSASAAYMLKGRGRGKEFLNRAHWNVTLPLVRSEIIKSGPPDYTGRSRSIVQNANECQECSVSQRTCQKAVRYS